jgi:hypothetical protein
MKNSNKPVTRKELQQRLETIKPLPRPRSDGGITGVPGANINSVYKPSITQLPRKIKGTNKPNLTR